MRGALLVLIVGLLTVGVAAYDIVATYESTRGQSDCPACKYPSAFKECSCPNTTTMVFTFSSQNDCAGHSRIRNGEGTICASGSFSDGNYFGGLYQESNGRCIHPNPLRGNICRCPQLYGSFRYQTYSAHVSSPVTLCFNMSAPGGGAYEVDDREPYNQGCRVPNPYNEKCECPAGYKPTFLRALVDDPGHGVQGSAIYVCTKP